jgi:hypothetical protein
MDSSGSSPKRTADRLGNLPAETVGEVMRIWSR